MLLYACGLRTHLYHTGMKFLMSIVVYLIIGLVLGLGMLQTVHGKPWLLVIGLIAYTVAFAKMGCLPKDSH
jgi:hypothetical protein